MCKLKFLVSGAMFFSVILNSPAFAENVAGAVNQPAAAEASPMDEPESSQTQIIQMVQDDYLFQKTYRGLKNELALEELRNKIRKLQGVDKLSPPTIAQPVDTGSETLVSADTVPMPRVLLETQIAGVSTVAVSDGNQIKYVMPGRIFDMNGKSYHLSRTQGNKLRIQEAN